MLRRRFCCLYPFTGDTGALTVIIRVREEHIHRDRPRIQFVFLLRSSQIARRVIARARLSELPSRNLFPSARARPPPRPHPFAINRRGVRQSALPEVRLLTLA